MQPSKEELAKQKHIQDSIMMARREAAILDSIRLAEAKAEEEEGEAIANSVAAMSMDSATYAEKVYQASRDKFGAFASAAMGEEQLFTYETNLQKITFSSKGGAIKQVELKDYRTYDSLPLISFDPETSIFELAFFSNNRIINTSQLYFEPYVNGNEIAMRAYADDINGQRNENQYLEFVYTLHDDNYMLDFDLRTVGLKDVIANNTNYMDLNWQVDLLQHEKDVDRFIKKILGNLKFKLGAEIR